MNERIPGQRVLIPLAIVTMLLVCLKLVPLPVEHVFVVLFTAVLLAAAISPAATALERYRVPRGVTVLIVYAIGFAVLSGIVALLVPLISGEVRALNDRLPQYNESLRRLIERVAPGQAERISADPFIQEGINQIAAYLRRATDFAVTLSAMFVRLVIVLVMAYFLTVEEDFAGRILTRFAPPEYRWRLHRTLSSVGNRLGHWARAQLLLALFFGVAFGLGLRVAGVPYAVTLGAIGGVIEIIPYIGGFLTLLLALLVAATKAPLLVLWVGVWYTVVVQLQAHVLAPFLMGRAVGMHPLVVVIALFIGAESLGIFGALLAVPIAVVLQATLDEFYGTPPASSLPPAPDRRGPVTEGRPQNRDIPSAARRRLRRD